MSHPPFTPEYMKESDMLATQIDVDDTKQKENQQEIENESLEEKSQIKYRPNRRICDGNPVTDAGQTDPDEDQLDAMEKIKEDRNVTITDEKKLSFFRILRMAMKRRMVMFAEEVSIAGLSYLVKPSNHKIGSIIRKVTWTMLLLFGIGFMVFQIYQKISFYLTYPTTVYYRVAYNKSLRFPTVTVCPESFISKKALLPYFGSQAEKFSSMIYPPLWDLSFSEEIQGLSFSQWTFVDIDWELFYDFVGLDMKETLLEVALLDPGDTPLMQSFGFRVGTGITTSISISLRNMTMLPSPYGVCRPTKNYRPMRCMLECALKFVVAECKCRSPQLDVPGIPVCSPIQYYYCVTKVTQWFVSSGETRKCDCPIRCHQATYSYSISTSPLSEHFLKYTSRRSQFKGRNLTMSKLGKELVYLDIYYSQLSYIDVKTTPAYEFLPLVCDVGGALGLILGGTLLTIFELLQLFIHLFADTFTSARFARMQRP